MTYLTVDHSFKNKMLSREVSGLKGRLRLHMMPRTTHGSHINMSLIVTLHTSLIDRS